MDNSVTPVMAGERGGSMENSSPGNTPSQAAVEQLKQRLGNLKGTPSFVSPMPRAADESVAHDASMSHLHLVRQNIFQDAVASPMTYASPVVASPYDKSSISINDSSMPADADTRDQLRILTGKLKLSQMMYDQIVAENLKVLRSKEKVEHELRETKEALEERVGQSPMHREQIHSFEQQFKPLCEDLISLRKNLALREASLAEALAAKSALEAQVNKMKVDVELAESEVALSRAELSRIDKIRAEAAEARGLKEKIEDMERNQMSSLAVQALKEEHKRELEQARASHRKECEVFEAENSELRGRCSDAESALDEALSRADTAEGRVSELEAVRDGLVGEIKVLEEASAGLREKEEEARGRAERLAAQNEVLVVEVPERFETKLAALRKEVEEGLAASAEREERGRRRLERCQGELARVRASWKALLVSHPDPDVHLAEAEEEMESLGKDVGKLEVKVAAMEAEHGSLVSEVVAGRLRLALANWRRPRYLATLKSRVEEATEADEIEEEGGGIDPSLFPGPSIRRELESGDMQTGVHPTSWESGPVSYHNMSGTAGTGALSVTLTPKMSVFVGADVRSPTPPRSRPRDDDEPGHEQLAATQGGFGLDGEVVGRDLRREQALIAGRQKYRAEQEEERMSSSLDDVGGANDAQQRHRQHPQGYSPADAAASGPSPSSQDYISAEFATYDPHAPGGTPSPEPVMRVNQQQLDQHHHQQMLHNQQQQQQQQQPASGQQAMDSNLHSGGRSTAEHQASQQPLSASGQQQHQEPISLSPGVQLAAFRTPSPPAHVPYVQHAAASLPGLEGTPTSSSRGYEHRVIASGGSTRSDGSKRGLAEEYRDKAARAEIEVRRLQEAAARRIEEARREADYVSASADMAIQSSRVDLERRIANPSVLSLRRGTSPPSTGSSPLPTPPTHQGQPHGGSVYGHTTPGGARYWTPQQHRRDTSASPVAESHRDHFQFSTSPAPVSLLAKDPRSGHVSPRDSVSPPGARAAAVHAAPPNTGRDWQGEDAGARKERVERIGGFDPDDIEWDAEVEM